MKFDKPLFSNTERDDNFKLESGIFTKLIAIANKSNKNTDGKYPNGFHVTVNDWSDNVYINPYASEAGTLDFRFGIGSFGEGTLNPYVVLTHKFLDNCVRPLYKKDIGTDKRIKS